MLSTGPCHFGWKFWAENFWLPKNGQKTGTACCLGQPQRGGGSANYAVCSHGLRPMSSMHLWCQPHMQHAPMASAQRAACTYGIGPVCSTHPLPR